MTAPSETSETIDPRRVSLYAGHFDALWGLAWSPDGTRIITGSEDATVRLWDASTGEMTGPCWFSPRGCWITV